MSAALATTGPTAYWYLTRATGAVALLLLTVTVVLGVLDVQRFSSERWPRFVVDRVHRDTSLLVLALLVVHIVTTVLDGFAPITLVDSVLPFVSAYRPLWLGLGALAFDLLLAVTLTSLLRRRLGYRLWRGVHWLAYASWPVAVFHTLGTGTDANQGWLLLLSAACVLAVALAVGLRISRAAAAAPAVRVMGAGAIVAVPLALAVFALLGPLAPHWARRAGTPTTLLRRAAPVAVRLQQAPASSARPRFPIPFTASLSGSVTQHDAPGGALVDLVLHCGGAIHGILRVRLAGQPMVGGGLAMTGSQVQLTADGLTSAFEGRVSNLQGQQFVARVSDAAGTVLVLNVQLNIDANNNVTGTLSGDRA